MNCIIKKLLIIQFLILFTGGCAIFNPRGNEKEETPEQLMEEGVSNYRAGKYFKAIDSFQQLKDRYPYSELAVEAEIKLADTFYKQKEFDEALDAYLEFERLHPKNKSIPYVIYRQGMTYYSRIGTVDRDQTSAYRALKEFERLKREFPDNPYSLKAERKIKKCFAHLAKYEYYVGQFYFKAQKYDAALKRFEYLISHYPDLGQYGDALTYIAICREKLGIAQK